MSAVVLATHNAKKLAELRRIVAGESALAAVRVLGLDDLPRYPEPAETGDTFAANALLKARACATRTGLAALADDSGLEVEVLNAMPGVRSARWSGPAASDRDNLELLLRQLDDVAAERRGARFVCALALVLPDGREHVVHAHLAGALATAPVGDGGFGYDPIFVPEGFTVTSAELSPGEKDAISHRGRALRAMLPVLDEAAAAGALSAGDSL